MRHVVYLLLVANMVYLGWNLLPGNVDRDPYTSLPPVPESARPLVTLQEMQQQTAARSAEDIDALTLNEPPSAVLPACRALGPFTAIDDVKAIGERLDGLGVQPRERTAEVREEDGFWVYLPSMDREAAQEVTAMLEENGDSEYYVGRDNFISLGTFNNIARAELRLEQVRKLGLDAILEARFRTRDSYWIEFRASDSADQELLAIMGRHPELQLQELSCLDR